MPRSFSFFNFKIKQLERKTALVCVEPTFGDITVTTSDNWPSKSWRRLKSLLIYSPLFACNEISDKSRSTKPSTSTNHHTSNSSQHNYIHIHPVLIMRLRSSAGPVQILPPPRGGRHRRCQLGPAGCAPGAGRLPRPTPLVRQPPTRPPLRLSGPHLRRPAPCPTTAPPSPASPPRPRRR